MPPLWHQCSNTPRKQNLRGNPHSIFHPGSPLSSRTAQRMRAPVEETMHLQGMLTMLLSLICQSLHQQSSRVDVATMCKTYTRRCQWSNGPSHHRQCHHIRIWHRRWRKRKMQTAWKSPRKSWTARLPRNDCLSFPVAATMKHRLTRRTRLHSLLCLLSLQPHRQSQTPSTSSGSLPMYLEEPVAAIQAPLFTMPRWTIGAVVRRVIHNMAELERLREGTSGRGTEQLRWSPHSSLSNPPVTTNRGAKAGANQDLQGGKLIVDFLSKAPLLPQL